MLGTAVPEAAVNKDSDSSAGEDDVGGASLCQIAGGAGTWPRAAWSALRRAISGAVLSLGRPAKCRPAAVLTHF